MTGVLPACLLESSFYAASIWDRTRHGFGRLGSPPALAAVLWVSALAPYLVFSLGTRSFHARSLIDLAVLFGLLAFWHVVLPRHWISDTGFLILVAVPVASKFFARIYICPDPHLHLDVLGHLAWIRIGLVSLLVLRGWNPGIFGIWPRGREWGVGIVYFLVLILPLVYLATGLHAFRFVAPHGPWWQIAGITIARFFGILWVVALSEELFFRGVVERALLDRWQSPLFAILVSAVFYGCSHLWYRHFPNWQDAIVTTILGIACGMAYATGGSVRTSMVTHTFAATTALIFFR